MPRHAPDEDQGMLARLHPDNAEAISLKVLRRQFAEMPEEKRRETRAYVAQLVAAKPTSYLARHAGKIYGLEWDDYLPPL